MTQSQAVDPGVHTSFIRSKIPLWVKHAHPDAIKALHQSQSPVGEPDWFMSANPALRQALLDCKARSDASHRAAAHALVGLKGITEFAEPLLVQAIRTTYGLTLDVNANEFVRLREDASWRIDKLSEVLISRQSLLQTALQNFEAADAQALRYDTYSALTPMGALAPFPDTVDPERRASDSIRYTAKLSITPRQFALFCRTLDLGQQYQDHLASVFDSPTTSTTLSQALTSATRDAMEVQVHTARMKARISEEAHARLMALLGRSPPASVEGGTPVRCSQLQLSGVALSDILVIGEAPTDISGPTPCIIYLPGDPQFPLKEYPFRAAFYLDLKARLQDPAYQRFFSRFVPRRLQSEFFNKLKADEAFKGQGALVESPITGELFDTLYKRMVAKAKDDAQALAVPTSKSDHEAWLNALEHSLDAGLDVLNIAAFFVPGLGEVMLTVMGAQLMGDIFHGIEAWEANEKEQAVAHLESVAINVAAIATIGAIAHTVGPALKACDFVDGLVPVEMPDGDTRLWKPTLAGYESDHDLPKDLEPNARGQYEHRGRYFVRLNERLFEQVLDERTGQWVIKAKDNAAYSPKLSSNSAGSWLSEGEHPASWSRAKLLRRIGPVTDGLTDAELELAAYISDTRDEALRMMQVEQQPVPPLLADTLERMKNLGEVDRLIRFTRNGDPVNSRPSPPSWRPRWLDGRRDETWKSSKVRSYGGRKP
ncbi:hypothetical protein NVV94_10100 [Pseudomonas sp. LS1212]|uniref:dermonecrotic toxin domain-containing protein n=1 Tax=Pseudomonas sp. LS1212 TaxID=2972478 RepID=UPI00215B9164|nr:DUF6543 domain-containing protein [Pseudomonas sp. LS1212]UVJ45858.1 hypothetical protein NVV94_10100 [Pseudomonas sp. LS1212]